MGPGAVGQVLLLQQVRTGLEGVERGGYGGVEQEERRGVG